MDSLVAPYQKIDDEVHSRFLGVEMNYSMDDFGKILEGLGYRKVKSGYSEITTTYYGKYCGYDAFLEVRPSEFDNSILDIFVNIQTEDLSKVDIIKIRDYITANLHKYEPDIDIDKVNDSDSLWIEYKGRRYPKLGHIFYYDPEREVKLLTIIYRDDINCYNESNYTFYNEKAKSGL